MDATVVLDIGKTNAKLTLLDTAGAILAEQRCPNSIVHTGPYPHHDTERLWHWLQHTLAAFAGLARITAIVPVTHGATAALVDDEALVLPILDYESSLPQALAAEYAALRPAFADSLSPQLPCGLNLGLQLYWLAKTYPAAIRPRAPYIDLPAILGLEIIGCGGQRSDLARLPYGFVAAAARKIFIAGGAHGMDDAVSTAASGLDGAGTAAGHSRAASLPGAVRHP